MNDQGAVLRLWNNCTMPQNIALRLGMDEEDVLCIVEDPENYKKDFSNSSFSDTGGGRPPPAQPSCDATTQ